LTLRVYKRYNLCDSKFFEEGKMPLVNVDLWEGRKVEEKKKLVAEITNLFVEITGCPKEAVTVIIRDVPKHNWGIGGELSSERFKGK